MNFKITRVAIQKQYPNLVNFDDIAEKICFASGVQIPSNNGIHPFFGAAFYFYITQNAMILNHEELQTVIDIIFNSQLVDFEIQAVNPLMLILQDIIALIAKTQQAQTEADKTICSDQAKNAIMNQDKSLFFQGRFSDGTLLASSLVLMSKLFAHPFFSQNAMLYSQLLMNDLSSICKDQFEMICQLFNISCTVYQEFEQSTYIAPLFTYSAIESPQRHALILSEDGKSIRFAYNSTLKNKEDFISNQLFLLDQEIQLSDLLNQSSSLPDPSLQQIITQIENLGRYSEQISQENEYYKKLITNTLKDSIDFGSFSETYLKKKGEYQLKIQELKMTLNKM